MIKINNLTKYYGDKLLFKNINLDIFDGEKFGIVGSNGAGKSTFLKILAGEIEPDFGAVKTAGKIAYVKQIAQEFDLNNINNEKFINFLKNKNKLNLNINNSAQFNNLSGGEKTK